MKTLFTGKKLYAVIIALLFIITFFITFHIIRNHYQYVVKETIAENKLKARFLSSLMYEHQKAAINILESYAQRPLFIDAVNKRDFNHVIPHMKSLNEHHTEMDAIFITDQYGTLWANYPVDRNGFGKNLAYRDWYKGVSKKWRPYISTVFRLIVLKKDLAVAVSVPVLDGKGKVIGILGSTQRTLFLTTFIKENIIDPEKSITLLDQEGNIIFSNTIGYQEDITKYPDAHVREKAVAGVIADMETADAKERGGISYISIAPVRGIGWSVIVGQEKKAILKSLSRYFILSTAIGFVIFLFFIACLLYFRREYKYGKTKEIIQAEEKCRNIIENAAEGIFQTTPEGLYISVNPALARMFGYESPEDMRGSVVDVGRQLYVNPEQRKEYLRLLDEKGGIEDYETQMYRKDGSIFWVSVNSRAVWDDAGNLLYSDGFVIDITERKWAEEELKERESLLQKIFDILPIGLWFADKDGKLLRGNPAGLKIWGAEPKVSPSEYGVFKARRLPSGEEIAPEDWALAHTVREGVTVVDEMLEIDAFDGKKKVILNYTAPVLDEKGEPQGAIVVNLDITARKQAEEELRISHLQLRALAKRLQHIREEDRIAIAREIHDEMGGGLTGLKMDLSWLLRKMSNADSGKERVALMDKIHTSNVLIDHMIRVVRRISTHLRPSILDDLGLIAALEWQLSEFTSHTEITHEFTTTCEYINMEEDTAIAVFRVFQEALTNVARHSRATKVAVVLREGERSLFGDESFVLEIRDNGKGITEEEILNPGSLGLLGMKERVLTFGGELSIRGEPGGGTALTLKIPRKQGEAS